MPFLLIFLTLVFSVELQCECCYDFWSPVVGLNDMFRVKEAQSLSSVYLYGFGLDTCSYREKLRSDKAHPHKLVAA